MHASHVHTCSHMLTMLYKRKEFHPSLMSYSKQSILTIPFFKYHQVSIVYERIFICCFFFSVGTIIKTFQVLENGSQNHLCRQGNEINQEYPVMNTSLAVVAGTMSGIMTTLQSMFGINRNIYEKLLDMEKTFTELVVLLQYTYVT